jgi:RsiW-degrading membrane proteinase PrsW (M82 family)
MLMANLIEKRARLPLVFVLVGIFISLFAAEINSSLRSLLPLSHYELTIIVTPMTEEVLKALPILFYALVISDKAETLFTASMAVGIGFAVLENIYYLFHVETWNILDAMLRAFGAGLMHGMCTLLVGAGITFVKKKRKLFWVGTFALLSTAIIYHGIYNMLVQSHYVVIGHLLPISTYIPFLIWRLKKKHFKKKA